MAVKDKERYENEKRNGVIQPSVSVDEDEQHDECTEEEDGNENEVDEEIQGQKYEEDSETSISGDASCEDKPTKVRIRSCYADLLSIHTRFLLS